MIYISEEFCNSHITVPRLVDAPSDSEWDVVALKTAIDSPFISARLSKMADYFMALQLIELDKENSFYSGENIYGWPLSHWLYSLTTIYDQEGNNDEPN